MSRRKKAAKEARKKNQQQRRIQQQLQRANNKNAGVGGGQRQKTSLVPVRGLTNLGSTCYFNSAIQCLMNTPLFGELVTESTRPGESLYIPNYLLNLKSNQKKENDQSILNSLAKLFQDYHSTNSPNSSTLTPSSLIGLIRQKTGRFPRNQQADSHELLRFLLDCCKSQIVDLLFGGHFLASVICRTCKSVSQQLEPFRDISLALNDGRSGKSKKLQYSDQNSCESATLNLQSMGNVKKNLYRLGSLTQSGPISYNSVHGALARFTANEFLDDSNKIHCEKCDPLQKKSTTNIDLDKKKCSEKIYQNGIKSTLIAIPPPILTIHLKRFKCDEDGQLSKLSHDVDFDEILDLSCFTSKIYQDIGKRTNCEVEIPILYSLFGVVCHIGSLRSGHYTAYVKQTQQAKSLIRIKKLLKFVKQKPRLPRQPTIKWIYSDPESNSDLDENEDGDGDDIDADAKHHDDENSPTCEVENQIQSIIETRNVNQDLDNVKLDNRAEFLGNLVKDFSENSQLLDDLINTEDGIHGHFQLVSDKKDFVNNDDISTSNLNNEKIDNNHDIDESDENDKDSIKDVDTSCANKQNDSEGETIEGEKFNFDVDETIIKDKEDPGLKGGNDEQEQELKKYCQKKEEKREMEMKDKSESEGNNDDHDEQNENKEEVGQDEKQYSQMKKEKRKVRFSSVEDVCVIDKLDKLDKHDNNDNDGDFYNKTREEGGGDEEINSNDDDDEFLKGISSLSISSNDGDETDVWFYISDSSVSRTNLSSVLRSQAYILFYERISIDVP